MLQIFDRVFIHITVHNDCLLLPGQVSALSNAEAKKRFEFLEAVSGTMDAHLRFFKQASFFLKTIFRSKVTNNFLSLEPISLFLQGNISYNGFFTSFPVF